MLVKPNQLLLQKLNDVVTELKVVPLDTLQIVTPKGVIEPKGN